MSDHDEESEARRREYQRRHLQALQDGGRVPEDAEWSELLGQARAVIEADARRRAAAVRGELGPLDLLPQGKEPRRFLPPGHVAVHAKVLLGVEAELNDAKASCEDVAQHPDASARVKIAQVIRDEKLTNAQAVALLARMTADYADHLVVPEERTLGIVADTQTTEDP